MGRIAVIALSGALGAAGAAIACGESPRDEAAPNVGAMASASVAFDAARFLGPLIRTCRATPGAVFDAYESACTCGDLLQHAPEVFTTRAGGGACVPLHLVAGSPCAGAGGYTAQLGAGDSAGIARLQKCLTDFGGYTDTAGANPHSFASIELPDAAAPGAAAISRGVAAWADGLGSRTPFRPRLWEMLWGPPSELVVHFGKIADTRFDDVVTNAIGLTFDGFNTDYTRTVFEADASGLPHVFSSDTGDDERAALFKAPTGSASRAELYDAYRVLFADRSEPYTFATGEAIYGDGCAGVCSLFTAPQALASGAVARLERLYIFGTVAREVIWVERNGETVGLVVLGPSGAPGLLLTLERTRTDTVQSTLATAYDRSWNVLGQKAYPLDTDYKSVHDTIYSHAVGSQGPGLVLCEASARGLLHSPSAASRVALGPYLPKFAGGILQSGSAFGWYPNLGGALEDYSWGVRRLALGFLPLPANEEHSANVTYAVLDTSYDVRILPLGADSCFTRFDQWYPVVPPTARVVNVSLVMRLLTSHCQDRALPPIRSSRNTLLWVAAAGNGDENAIGQLSPKNQCPQALAGEENLIVVAAVSGSDLASYSDYGPTYADIAASGDVNGSHGTSFASPRVATIAVVMGDANPSLSPAEIRWALLVSARAVAALEPKVRSGGVLDEGSAMKVAACFGRLKTAGNPLGRAAVRACGIEAMASADWVDDRLRLLEARGVSFR